MAEDTVFILVVGEKVFRKENANFSSSRIQLLFMRTRNSIIMANTAVGKAEKIDLFPPKFMRHAKYT